MNTINRADLGEIFHRINEAEINFRFENLCLIGFRWAVIGHEEPYEPGKMRLYRAEIDDGIQGILEYSNDIPHELRFLGFDENTFSVKNANEQLKSLHLMQKDWLERGAADDIEIAVADLCAAICKHYPDSEF